MGRREPSLHREDPVTIRPAASSDAPALAELAGQLGYPCSPDQARRRLAPLVASDGTVLVAVRNERVVGWTHVLRVDRLEADPFAELGGLVVDASCRGQGVGSALLGAAETWPLVRGLSRLRVRSNVVREDAHRFYATRGYVLSKRQAIFDKPLDGP
jgi:GNAT superfamily N-acetyltransferase